MTAHFLLLSSVSYQDLLLKDCYPNFHLIVQLFCSLSLTEFDFTAINGEKHSLYYKRFVVVKCQMSFITIGELNNIIQII